MLPTGGTIRYEYDPNGNRTGITDPEGNRTVMEYDERNRLIRTTDPSGTVTEYGYDTEGNRVRVTDAAGNSCRYEYDAAGQLISETDVPGNTTRYEYDTMGRIAGITDPKGRRTLCEYGKNGKMSRKSAADGTVTCYEYDRNGNLILQRDPGGRQLKYTYDCLNRLISVKNHAGQEKRYTYDAVGNVTSVTDAPGHVTWYEYSPGGRLTSVVDAAGNRTEYAYDAMGGLTVVCRHEGMKKFLDSQGRLSLPEEYPEDQVRLTRYERGPSGAVETMIDPLGQKEHYTVDLSGRISSRTDRDGYVTRYAYNPSGDSVCHGTSMEHRYLYDAANRLSLSMNAEGRVSGYRYNGLGQRTGIREYMLTGFAPETPFSEYIIACADPVREVEYLLDLTRPYHNLLEKSERDKERASVQTYIWDTNTAFLKEGKATHIYLQDELGSPVRLIQSGGKRQTLYGYDEFGNDRYGNQGELQPFGYTGYQRDRTAGSYFAQAREYLPEVGRFMGRDLIKGLADFPFTLNEYGYCWNNPLMLVDRNGAWPEFIENVGKWCEENIDTTAAIKLGIAGLTAAAAVVLTVGTFGVGGGVFAASSILASGVIGGWINTRNDENPVDGFSGGALNASIIVLSACVPGLWSGSLGMQVMMGMIVNTQAAYWGTFMTEVARGKSYEEIKEDAAVSIMGQSYFSGIWGSIVGSVLGTYHPIAVVISAIYGAAASIVSDALIPLLVNDQNTASDGIECGE